MSSGRSTRGIQREPAGGGWFPGTVEAVGGAETQLDWAEQRTGRKETGIRRQDSRREDINGAPAREGLEEPTRRFIAGEGTDGIKELDGV